MDSGSSGSRARTLKKEEGRQFSISILLLVVSFILYWPFGCGCEIGCVAAGAPAEYSAAAAGFFNS